MGRPHISILYIQSYLQAIQVIEMSPPDLIISAFSSERTNGFEFIWDLKRRLGELPELIFFLPKGCPQRREILEFLDLGLYSAEENPRRILRMIEDRVERKKKAIPHEGLSFSELSPQLLLAMTSGFEIMVQVLDEQGPCGEIMVSKGGIWSARDAQGEGVEAFFRLLDRGVTATCAPINKEIMGPYQFQSEAEEETTEEVKELIEEGIEAILRKDLNQAAMLFKKAKKRSPENPLIIANLQRLQKLGILSHDEL